MHIAHVTRIVWEHGTHGGMEAHSRALVAGLRARGHRVTTITTACPGCSDDGETFYLAGMRPGRYSAAWWRESAQAVAGLHRADPVDVLLSQSAAGRSMVRIQLSIPSLFVLHGTLVGELRTRWRNARSPRGLALLAHFLATNAPEPWRWRRALPLIDHFVAVSEATAADAQRTMGIPAERLSVVPAGVDTSLWRPDAGQRGWLRQELGLDGGATVLVAAGRVVRSKGYQVAIESLAQLDAAAHLVILGDGSALPWLRQRAARAGLGDRVHFPGFVEPALLARYFQGADLFLMPTLCDEGGLPLSLLQALACGLPVVASDLGGVREAVQPGETALLTPPGDGAALGQAVASLLADRPRLAQMSEAARAQALAAFSEERMVAGFERLLQQVAERAPR
jgi:glycosyltransferase involved in cell wall biosynthesis